MSPVDPVDPAEPPFVSTGRLPAPERVRSLVEEGHARYSSNQDGATSQVYPALARVPAELFGICVVGVDGGVFAVGDADTYPDIEVFTASARNELSALIGAGKPATRTG